MNLGPCLLLGTLLASPPASPSSGNLELRILAQTEMEITNARGEKEIVRTAASKVLPGAEVIYTISCKNAGSAPAEAVAITNPIPEHMVYTLNSAFGSNSVITYSVDGGKTYDAPDRLMVLGPDGNQRRAVPADFTHIRWLLETPLTPGEIRDVGFRSRLE